VRRLVLPYPLMVLNSSRALWCFYLAVALGTFLLVACSQAPATAVDKTPTATNPVPTPALPPASTTIDEVATDEAKEEPAPGDQANAHMSITNDEDALNSRVKIVNEDLPIDPVETNGDMSAPSNPYQPQPAAILGVDNPVLMVLNVSALTRPGSWSTAIGGSASTRRGQAGSELGTRDNSGRSGSQKASEIVLTLVAEVSPPIVACQLVQATSIAIKGEFAYVSYNMRGESFLGAVDVFDIKNPDRPRLVSEAIFSDSDIHSLTFDGGKVYAAQGTGAAGFETPSAFEVITTKKGKLVLEDNAKTDLPSFAGTSVIVSGKYIYVTSGNTGGVSVFDKNNFELKKHIPLHDARWVDVEDDLVVVVQGSPGQVSVFDEKTLTLLNTFSFNGANVPESKSTVQVLGEKAWIAAGPGGMQSLSIVTGEVVGTVPLPLVPDLDPSVVTTNAVSEHGSLVFISNGEAGVYLAEAAKDIDKTATDTPQEIVLLGKLRFGDLQSANHVEHRGKMLFVAAGSGGLKIVKVERPKTD